MTKKRLEQHIAELESRISVFKEANHKFQVETLEAKETARWAREAIEANDKYANQINKLIDMLHLETIGAE